MIKIKKNAVFSTIVFLFVFAFLYGFFTKLFNRGSFICGSIYYICLISFIVYTLKVIEKKSLESIGIDYRHIIKQVILGIGIFVILTFIFWGVFLLCGTKPNFIHLTLFETLFRIIYYISLVGFAEELIFRGYLLDQFKKVLNSKLYAVLLSSVLFALWHYPVSYNIGQVIFAFFFGIILSTIKVKSKGNIIISLAIGHGLYNSFLCLVGYFIK